MKAMLVALALTLPLSAIAAEDLEFAIITGVDSLKRVRNGSNLMPWEHEAPGEVIVSLSCGFAEAVYRRATAPGISKLDDEHDSKPWRVLVMLGHYCKLGEYALDGWNLVAYRTWKGKNYLIDFAEILVAEDQRLYVDEMHFIESSGLKPAACTLAASECGEPRVYIDAINTLIRRNGKVLIHRSEGAELDE